MSGGGLRGKKVNRNHASWENGWGRLIRPDYLHRSSADPGRDQVTGKEVR